MNHWLILFGHEPPPPITHGRKVRPLDTRPKRQPENLPPEEATKKRRAQAARLIYADGSSQEFASLMDLARSAGISKTKAGNMSLDGRPDAHGRRIERIGKQTGSTCARAVKVIHANGRTHTYPSATAAAKSQGISLATVLNKISQGSRDAKGRRYQYAD